MTKRSWKGRKNNYVFKIRDYTEGWGYKHKGWYVFIEDKKTDKSYNSLHDNIYFLEIEDAKKWCEDYADNNKGR